MKRHIKRMQLIGSILSFVSSIMTCVKGVVVVGDRGYCKLRREGFGVFVLFCLFFWLLKFFFCFRCLPLQCTTT